MKKEATFTIRKTSVNPYAREMVQLVQASNGKELPAVVKIGVNESTGKTEFYAEDIKPEKCFGFLKKDSSKEALPLLERALDGISEYEIRVTGFDGKEFSARIAVSIPDAQEPMPEASKEVEAAKKEALEKGCCSEEEIDRNIAVMKGLGCSDSLVCMTLKTYRKYEKPARVPKTVYIDPEKGEKGQGIFTLCLLNTLIGAATIYEGDKSVGKNMCAETIAMVRNQPFYMITFNRTMTADDIYGTKATDNSASAMLTEELAEAHLNVMRGKDSEPGTLDKAARFEYLKAKAASVSIIQEEPCLVEWLKNGGVMCFNEMNMADANFFSSFANQLTDGSGFIDIPGHGRIEINKDCVLIGTQNADYTGTCEQNAATMSRFACVQFDYPESIKPQLKAMCGNTGLDEEYFKQADNLYKALRSGVQKGFIDNACLNIRGFGRALDAVGLIPGVTTLKKQVTIQVVNTCAMDDRDFINKQVSDYISL